MYYFGLIVQIKYNNPFDLIGNQDRKNKKWKLNS